MAEKDDFKFPDEIDEAKGKPVDSEDEGFDIEIVDDTPPEDRGRKPADPPKDVPEDELAKYDESVQARIKKFTRGYHDERRAKEAAERERAEALRLAQQAIEENKRLKQYVQTGETTYQEMMQKAAESELDVARRKLKEAQESFDADAIIEAQEALTSAMFKREAAKNFKPTPLQKEESAVQIQPSVQEVPRPDEKSLRWQAKNQWFGASGFEEISSYALGLHQKLVSSGVDPRSDEYFEQIDARVKSKFPEVFGEAEEKPRSVETPRRPSSVVAPATRSAGSKKIQLTPTQAALIKKYNLDPKKYVAEVLKLENQ